MTITEPGVHYDMDADTYHADPVPSGSLSVTRAKTLLTEAGPAKFRHRADHGQPHKAEYDLGHAAHALVLGKDADRLLLVDADSWRTAAAQAARADAYAQGKTPLLPAQMRQAEDMAEALASHSRAIEVLAGDTEVSMFWLHDGLWLRGRADVMSDACTGDYKTTVDASQYGVIRDTWRFRYHMQAAWYRTLRGRLTGDWLPYRLVVQEKAAPYLVSVWEVPDDYLELGRADMDDAIRIYLECTATGRWPGYPDDIQLLTPPAWAYDPDDITITED